VAGKLAFDIKSHGMAGKQYVFFFKRLGKVTFLSKFEWTFNLTLTHTPCEIIKWGKYA